MEFRSIIYVILTTGVNSNQQVKTCMSISELVQKIKYLQLKKKKKYRTEYSPYFILYIT